MCYTHPNESPTGLKDRIKCRLYLTRSMKSKLTASADSVSSAFSVASNNDFLIYKRHTNPKCNRHVFS